MSEVRSRHQIAFDLLNVARTGAKKTRLVYQGNLNFKVLKRYLIQLLESNLLEREGSLYFTTEKGLDYLESFGCASRLF